MRLRPETPKPSPAGPVQKKPAQPQWSAPSRLDLIWGSHPAASTGQANAAYTGSIHGVIRRGGLSGQPAWVRRALADAIRPLPRPATRLCGGRARGRRPCRNRAGVASRPIGARSRHTSSRVAGPIGQLERGHLAAGTVDTGLADPRAHPGHAASRQNDRRCRTLDPVVRGRRRGGRGRVPVGQTDPRSVQGSEPGLGPRTRATTGRRDGHGQ